MTLDAAARQSINNLKIYSALLGQDIPEYAGEPNIIDAEIDTAEELVAWGDFYAGAANPGAEEKTAFNQEIRIQLSVLGNLVLDEFRRAGFSNPQVKSVQGALSLVSSYNGKNVSFILNENLLSTKDYNPQAFRDLSGMLGLAQKAIDTHGATSVLFNNQRMDVALASGSLSLYPPQVNEFTLSGAALEYARHLDENPKVTVYSSGDVWIDSGLVAGDADEYSVTEKNQREAAICNGRGGEVGASPEEIRATLESAYSDTFDDTTGSYLDRVGYASLIASSAAAYAKKGILSFDYARSMAMRLVNDKDPRRVEQGISILGQLTGDVKSEAVLVSIIRNSDNMDYVSLGIGSLAQMMKESEKESPFYDRVLQHLSEMFYDLETAEGQRKFACLRNLEDAVSDNNMRLLAETFKEALNWS